MNIVSGTATPHRMRSHPRTRAENAIYRASRQSSVMGIMYLLYSAP